jgi:hypothetical protein
MPSPPSMFDAPRAAISAAPTDNYIQPDLGHGLRIWWAFYWRTALSSTVLAIALNLALRRLPSNTAIVFLARYDVYLFYFIAAFFAMAYILRKKFRYFRIALLSDHGGDNAKPLPPTLHRTARIWWTFCWRSVVYRIIVAVVASFPLTWITGFLAAIVASRGAFALINLLAQVFLDAVVGMFVIYSCILDEDISDFRVALLPPAVSTAPIATAALPADVVSG